MAASYLLSPAAVWRLCVAAVCVCCFGVRRVAAQCVVTTLAGGGGSGAASGFVDGVGSAALFNQPTGIAVDSSGVLFVADSSNNIVRTITPSGTVATLAGGGATGTAAGSFDGTGTAASLSEPTGVAVSAALGTLFVGDAGNNNVRAVMVAAATTTTVAGSGSMGFADGAGSTARFSGPVSVAADFNGTLYVADWGNSKIRRIATGSVVTTLAGGSTTGGLSGVVDGTAALGIC